MQNERNHHPAPGRPVSPQQDRPQLGLEADQPTALRAQDHWRVDLAEDWEIFFWSREFNCSENELRRAVKEVGSNAGAVRAFLSFHSQQDRSQQRA
jgi:AraC-like DNA-binding protein